MNLSYEKIYRVYDKIPWYLKDNLFPDFTANIFMRDYNERFNKELEIIFKKMYPKKKKVDVTTLPEEMITPIREKYQNIFLANLKAKFKQIGLLRKLLNELSLSVEIVPTEEMNLIRTSSASTFSSQGWGANKYARAVVQEDLEMLRKLGYKVEIRERPTYEGSTDWKDFELWVNITDWQFDCITRREKFDWLTWSCDCWKRGVNPKVINPFLDDKIYYKSLEEWNK